MDIAALLPSYKVQELTGSTNRLNMLLRRTPVRQFLALLALLSNPVHQFRVGAEGFGHIGMAHLSSSCRSSPKKTPVKRPVSTPGGAGGSDGAPGAS